MKKKYTTKEIYGYTKFWWNKWPKFALFSNCPNVESVLELLATLSREHTIAWKRIQITKQWIDTINWYNGSKITSIPYAQAYFTKIYDFKFYLFIIDHNNLMCFIEYIDEIVPIPYVLDEVSIFNTSLLYSLYSQMLSDSTCENKITTKRKTLTDIENDFSGKERIVSLFEAIFDIYKHFELYYHLFRQDCPDADEMFEIDVCIELESC